MNSFTYMGLWGSVQGGGRSDALHSVWDKRQCAPLSCQANVSKKDSQAMPPSALLTDTEADIAASRLCRCSCASPGWVAPEETCPKEGYSIRHGHTRPTPCPCRVHCMLCLQGPGVHCCTDPGGNCGLFSACRFLPCRQRFKAHGMTLQCHCTL